MARMAWRPKQYKPTVVKLHPPPGTRAAYSPMEDHPDWTLYDTGAGDSPTTFYHNAGRVEVTRAVTLGEAFPLMYSGYGQIDDVDISFTATFSSGGSDEFRSYEAVKGEDLDNFVGVTIYNGAIRIYERVAGAWNLLVDGGSDADIIGKTVRFTVTGDQAELFVDGVSLGAATTAFSGPAYMGLFVQAHPTPGILMEDMRFTGRRVGAEVQIVPCNRAGWSITESSAYSADYRGREAFNCTTVNGGDAWVSRAEAPPQWVAAIQDDTIQWQPTRIEMKGRVVITNEHMNDRRPDPLVLEGSDDGTTWTEIQRWTNTGAWNAGQVKTFIVTARAAFHHFRFVWENFGAVDSEVGGQMGWIKLYGYDVSSEIIDIDHDGKPDTTMAGAHMSPHHITEDADSYNVDVDGDGNADIIIPKDKNDGTDTGR